MTKRQYYDFLKLRIQFAKNLRTTEQIYAFTF